MELEGVTKPWLGNVMILSKPFLFYQFMARMEKGKNTPYLWSEYGIFLDNWNPIIVSVNHAKFQLKIMCVAMGSIESG